MHTKCYRMAHPTSHVHVCFCSSVIRIDDSGTQLRCWNRLLIDTDVESNRQVQPREMFCVLSPGWTSQVSISRLPLAREKLKNHIIIIIRTSKSVTFLIMHLCINALCHICHILAIHIAHFLCTHRWPAGSSLL